MLDQAGEKKYPSLLLESVDQQEKKFVSSDPRKTKINSSELFWPGIFFINENKNIFDCLALLF